MGDAAVAVESLGKAYGETVAVRDVSFEVSPGEIFGLIGPNGSGKTTTVECVQGLRHPDTGTIRVFGLDPEHDRHALGRIVGCQLQDSALPDRIKVWEALDLFGSLAARSVDWEALLDDWGLSEKRSAAYANLSGGQRQRLLVALALVNDPKIVFLDEMTTGLDPAARRVAWELIERIRDRGKTVILVTHFMDEAERLCDRIAVLQGGLIVDSGVPAELIARHAPEVVVSFSTDVADLDWLGRVDHVRRVKRRGDRVDVIGTGPVLALVGAALVEHGLAPVDLRSNHSSLEDVFLALTGGGMEES